MTCKGLGALLLAGLICSPVSAEEKSAVEKLINTQVARFNEAYTGYIEACVNLSKKEQRATELQIRLPAGCVRAKNHYELQADILVRLLHGDKVNSPTPTD